MAYPNAPSRPLALAPAAVHSTLTRRAVASADSANSAPSYIRVDDNAAISVLGEFDLADGDGDGAEDDTSRAVGSTLADRHTAVVINTQGVSGESRQLAARAQRRLRATRSRRTLVDGGPRDAINFETVSERDPEAQVNEVVNPQKPGPHNLWALGRQHARFCELFGIKRLKISFRVTVILGEISVVISLALAATERWTLAAAAMLVAIICAYAGDDLSSALDN